MFVSLALRGSGAFGAAVGETAAFGGGERIKKKNWGTGGTGRGVSLRRLRREKNKIKIRAPPAPQMVLKT